MKIFFSKTMIFLGVFSLVMGTITAFGSNISYADNLEIIGNEIGLEVSPSGTKLFDLTNLNPGDTKEAKIDIKNNYTLPFEVFMRTERLSPLPNTGEVDLFEQLNLTIYLDDIEIYTGPMKDYATTNISLGDFNSNDEKELRAIVHLPGPETGNEFQGKNVDVKWIFIAQAEQPDDPDDPDDPDEPDDSDDPDEPQEPEEPEQPEEEVEVEEEIPESVPEEPEEEVTTQEIEEPEEVEEIEEEIPEAQPKMPKTGEIPAVIYYGLGTALLGLGIGTGRKKEK
jgi:LPXTG-motif cell wall-anchored protein